MSKKSAPSHASTKSTAATTKSHNARRNDAPSVNTTNHSVKTSSRPSSAEPAYEQQVPNSLHYAYFGIKNIDKPAFKFVLV